LFSEINLTELQKTLDAQGIELVDNQKESLLGRKALADKTKGVRLASPFSVPNNSMSSFRVQEDFGNRQTKCIQGFT
jgi:hypothetical protein